VTRVNTTHGLNWQRPQAILAGRFEKLGVQVDFRESGLADSGIGKRPKPGGQAAECR